MKKMITGILMMLFMMASGAFADGFVNPQDEYFYKKGVEITLDNQYPIYGGKNICVGVQYPGTATFTAISDTLNNVEGYMSFNWIPEVVASSATFGVFENPNGVWEPAKDFELVEATISKSSGTFDIYPSQMYNRGTYPLVMSLVPAELPDSVTLQYAIGGVVESWRTETILPVAESIEYPFYNVNTEDVVIRIVYNNTEDVIAQTLLIPSEERLTYFTFRTTEGTKYENQEIPIFWEKSDNFEYVHLKIVYQDGSKEYDDTLYSDTFINFNPKHTGIYIITGNVKSEGFNYMQHLRFEVITPCEDVEKELAECLLAINGDSTHIGYIELISKLEKDTLAMGESYVKLDSAFTKWKIEHPDTSFTYYQLIFDGDTTIVSVNDDKINTGPAINKDFWKLEFNVPLKNASFSVFNYIGEYEYKSETVNYLLKEINLEEFVKTTGTIHFLYIKYETYCGEKYYLYRFRK